MLRPVFAQQQLPLDVEVDRLAAEAGALAEVLHLVDADRHELGGGRRHQPSRSPRSRAGATSTRGSTVPAPRARRQTGSSWTTPRHEVSTCTRAATIAQEKGIGTWAARPASRSCPRSDRRDAMSAHRGFIVTSGRETRVGRGRSGATEALPVDRARQRRARANLAGRVHHRLGPQTKQRYAPWSSPARRRGAGVEAPVRPAQPSGGASSTCSTDSSSASRRSRKMTLSRSRLP